MIGGCDVASAQDARLLVAGAFDGVAETALAALRDAGFHDVTRIADLDAALRRIAGARPDLVVLDLCGEIGAACATCAAFHDAAGDTAPIVAYVAGTAMAERARLLDAGAANVLGAPLSVPELLLRVKQRLRGFQLARQSQKFRERLEEELAVARAAQKGLMPSPAHLAHVRAVTGLDVAAHCESSSELGGDIWGLHALDRRRLSMFLADFSGHGIGAALNAFRLHTMTTERLLLAQLDTEQVLELLNERLAALLPRGTFATMFYAAIDLDRNVLAYASAGAPPVVIVQPDGDVITLDTSGLPLAMRRGQQYEARRATFARGAALLLYSDALIETRDQDGAVWTTETLSARWAAGAHCRDAAETVRGTVAAFAVGRPRPLPDDLTLVCIRRPRDASH